MAPSEEDQVIENASYLSEVMDMKFEKCYRMASSNKGLSKEALVQKWIET